MTIWMRNARNGRGSGKAKKKRFSWHHNLPAPLRLPHHNTDRNFFSPVSHPPEKRRKSETNVCLYTPNTKQMEKRNEGIRLKYDVNHDRKSFPPVPTSSSTSPSCVYSWRNAVGGMENDFKCIKMTLFSAATGRWAEWCGATSNWWYDFVRSKQWRSIKQCILWDVIRRRSAFIAKLFVEINVWKKTF